MTDLYLNPDPWARLIGERNEHDIVVNGKTIKSLIDSGAQLSQITLKCAKQMGLRIKKLKRIIKVEGAAGKKVPYFGYVEVGIKIPEVTGFNEPCLLLVTRDTTYGEICPIILGTLHIDMVLDVATKEELEKLGRVWERAGLGAKIATQQAKVTGELKEIKGSVKLLHDVVIPPGETVTVKGKSNHPIRHKRVNVIIEPCDGPNGEYTVRTYTFTKRNSNRVEILMRNLSLRSREIKKGTVVASLEAANKVPQMLAPDRQITPESPEKVLIQQANRATEKRFESDSEEIKEERLEKLFSKLDLSGCEDWSTDNQESIRELITNYEHLFALDTLELGKTSLVKHKIVLDDEKPFKERHHRVPPHQYEEVRKHLKEMLDIGAIRPSHSPWASPVVLARKKNGDLRFCIDLRKLNNRTVKDAHALPRIEDSLDSLNGATIFSSLDLKSGYWQVELEEDSIPLTAFTVGPLGFYECCRMPFGLCNAPATFQRLMESCLGELHLQQCIIYLDDIIIFSRTPEEHIERIRNVFEKLSQAGLKLKPNKCDLFKKEITYLGHVVSAKGIRTDESKIQAIKDWPQPKTVTEVRSFLGFTNYYRKFVYKYAHVARPLNSLIAGENAKKKRQKVTWNDECEQAFQKLKEICTNTPILAYADYKKPFRLNTDASTSGLGAVLYQKQDDDSERVIAFASRTLTKTERNYDAHRLEFLALKWAVTERFHEYLYGGRFEVYTDNNPLTYVLTSAKLDAASQRWVASLANYDFKIHYRSGKSNADADGLSRIPWDLEEVEDFELPIVTQCMITTELNTLPPVMPTIVNNLQIQWERRRTRSDWQFEQGADENIGRILDLIVNKKSHKLNRDDTPEFKALWKMKKNLELIDGLLYRRIFSTRMGMAVHQFVLPEKFRKTVVEICHDDYGHLGTDRVTQLLQDRFFWPKMSEDVKRHITSCDRCIRYKQPQEREKLHPITASYPFELIHMDFLKIGGKDDKYKNILVITDHFTRFATAFVTNSESAPTVAKILVHQYFPAYQWPEKILTDQGGCFESLLFKNILKLTEIKKLRTSPYRPSTNGQAEKFNSTLLRMLGTLPNSEKPNWAEWVPTLVHAYNCTISKVTGYSPHYLMFGRLPRLPIDIEFDTAIRTNKKDYSKFVQELEDRLRDAHAKAQEMIAKETKRQKRYYDKAFKCAVLKPGDLVLVRVKQFGTDHKIADRWEEPIYRVIQQVKDQPAYNIQNTDNQQCRVIHRNHLFPLRLRKTEDEMKELTIQSTTLIDTAFEKEFGCDCYKCQETLSY